MALSPRAFAAASLIAGLILGGLGGWFTMRSVCERHLATAEAANAMLNLRALKALRDGDSNAAEGSLETALVGNVVVLDAWARGRSSNSDELPVKALRDIALYDADVRLFSRDPQFEHFLMLLKPYAPTTQPR